MENLNWHEQQQAYISRIAMRMSKIAILGHTTVQADEYYALSKELLWQQEIKQWHDSGSLPPRRNF